MSKWSGERIGWLSLRLDAAYCIVLGAGRSRPGRDSSAGACVGARDGWGRGALGRADPGDARLDCQCGAALRLVMIANLLAAAAVAAPSTTSAAVLSSCWLCSRWPSILPCSPGARRLHCDGCATRSDSRSVLNCGDSFNLNELVVVAEHGNAHECWVRRAKPNASRTTSHAVTRSACSSRRSERGCYHVLDGCASLGQSGVHVFSMHFAACTA